MELLHTAENPRNSEGSFLKLSNGTIRFYYTRFSGGHGDHAAADIVSIDSADGGETWNTDYRIEVKNTGVNVMSVSLLRLQSGRILMLYLQKSMQGERLECRPFVQYSEDEGETWSDPVAITGPEPRYLVINNDRVVQLRNGRIIIPVADHGSCTETQFNPGVIQFILSDDGRNWRTVFGYTIPETIKGGAQEPGVIELKDGSLLSWTRTHGGYQYVSRSTDGGETWSASAPETAFPSIGSPLSMKRDPVSGVLVAIWDHYLGEPPETEDWWRTRNCFVLATSSDEGKTWWDVPRLLAHEDGHGYCYTAMLFHDGKLLLGYCSGFRSRLLSDLTIRNITVPDIDNQVK